MNKYVIDLAIPDINNAGPKARNDVNYFLKSIDYKLIKLFFPSKYIKGLTPLVLKLCSYGYLIYFTKRIEKRSTILIQYPIPYAYIKTFWFMI